MKPVDQLTHRLPIAISALALAVVLSRGASEVRVGHAADTVPERGRQTLMNLQDAFTGIADKVEPSVVGIHVEPPVTHAHAGDSADNPDMTDQVPPRDFDPFGGLPFDFGPFTRRGTPRTMPSPRLSPATGSGVLIQHEGNTYYVLTNNHVVEGGGRIRIQLNGQTNELRGTLVGTDPKTDLAVVKLTIPGGNQPTVEFADSDSVKVGQWAIAIGNPLDVGETLTVGVISAKGRALTGQIPDSVADYSDMIQTDASINPGNSGGALVDINGRLIGINTAIASPSRGSIGIGFAIPSNAAREIAQQLIRRGEVVRGWLGVNTTTANQTLKPAMAAYYGVARGAFVDSVEPDTPASRAGIRPEDIITQWNGRPVASFQQLSREVGNTPPGRDVPVELYRNGKALTVTVHTEKRPSEADLQRRLSGRPSTPNGDERPAPTATASSGGVTVRALTSAERAAIGSDGVAVVSVDQDTPAYDAFLAPGAVIHRVGGMAVRTPAEFTAAMNRVSGKGYVLRISSPTAGGGWSQRTLAVEPPQ